jgi:RNase P subunit RPR2
VLRAKFLRRDNNPGLVDHAWRKTMRHWITSFRLVDDANHVTAIREIWKRDFCREVKNFLASGRRRRCKTAQIAK